MTPATLAGWEGRLRPWMVHLPAPLLVRLYSHGRRRFVDELTRCPPARAWAPGGHDRVLWGIRFRSPLLNAAGMFKQGRGYELAAAQGAGGWLAGTSTHRPRSGNHRHGVRQPFAPYPRSRAASNWLGLPNPGHRVVADRLARLERVPGCPIGASLSACPDPDVADDDKLSQLVAGLELYTEAGVDFLEINESCPNTEDDRRGVDGLEERLRQVADGFLGRTSRPPVVVKLSCDTAVGLVPRLLAFLVEQGYDGVNFGNTSTDYSAHRDAIASDEAALFDHFTRRYGGGVSGRPLAARSLALVSAASAWLAQRPPSRELHVVRTGGVETAADVAAGLAAGASLCGWYTGYFEAFARHGHAVYKRLLAGLAEAQNAP